MKKYAIVTGAASGIGLDVATRLSDMGIRVFGLDLKPYPSANFHQFICDVSCENDIIQTLNAIREETDHIDYLINVAGVLTVNGKRYIKDMETIDWNQILSNNLTSVFMMLRHTFPLLKASHGAAVVSLSSDQSLKGQQGFCAYGVSKVGINMLTQIAADEFYGDGIRVNAIAPGAVKTNFLTSLFPDKVIKKIYETEGDNILKPFQVTDLICFLISDQCKTTGKVFSL
ncbi:SDR family oxidoreductase [Prevotella sp. E13-27]|uniref:SDR family oxidoreductase n=1 Tax=Prevotella sp. E13-27 TaxID=2938122 RepID=UPI00200B566E|nr:SDR family oxidoreductase [Prevotella sp. E13-27]MCK8621897.1 SDR family oxidoreductase [Prevotella sp. E13-27]